MKKICFFNTCKVWGGGEKWHLEVATALDKDSNYEVIICTSPNSPLFEKSIKKNLKTNEFKIGNLSFLNIKLLIKIYKYFKKEKFDTIIMNLPSDLKTAGIVAKLLGINNIIYRRGSAIPIKNNIFNRFVFRKIIDKVIVNSNYTKKTIFQNNKKIIDEEKIFLIYNGIDTEEYLKRDYNFVFKRKKDEIILGNAGRLSYQKGQKYLIDIALELKRRNIEFKILIAGVGELEESLKRYAKNQCVEDSLIFLGFVENVKSFMKSIDVFLLTSIWEGFGYVMVEAMLAEKPIIAFDTSNNSEIICNNKSGKLVEFGDIHNFCNKIEEYIFDKKLIDNNGKFGRELVEKNFSIDICLDNIKKII